MEQQPMEGQVHLSADTGERSSSQFRGDMGSATRVLLQLKAFYTGISAKNQ